MKTTKKLVFMMALLLASLSSSAADKVEKTPAFPGAEGFGRYVTGGRGGAVYHVTSLADDGSEGTLRWACQQKGARTIVFDVSGTIHLSSALSLSQGNVTIAGQSAPGYGICIADYPFSINANNVIIRYLRFRLGNQNVTENGADGWDGLGGMDKEDIIVDHCSVCWSIDECLSIYGVKNATVQWCISSQSLRNAGHSKGAHGYGGNWGGSGITYHHNLMAHHESRTPRLGPRYTTQLDERMDMRNNVIYNWAGNGCYGGEAMNVNIVNNYYKPGPATLKLGTTKQMRIAGIGIRTDSYTATYPAYAPTHHVWGKFYVDGNVNSKHSQVTSNNWQYGIYNQISSADNDNTYTSVTKDTMKLSTPIDHIHVTTHTAETAYAKVLDYVGCCKKRDSYDDFIINETRNGLATYTGGTNNPGIIDSPEDNRPADSDADWSPLPDLGESVAQKDTDGDGMPDLYEDTNGLDANNPADGAQLASNGYTHLENYLNSLVKDITEACLEGGEVSGSELYVGEEPVVTKYELTPQTSNGGWDFSNGFSISTSKGYASGSSCGITGIKYSRNTQFTINIPDGISIAKIAFTGYSNVDDADSYLGELNGKTYGESEYVFPSRTTETTATHTISFDTPVSKTLTFTPKGQQTVWNITLHAATATGIQDIQASDNQPNAIYTLDGRRIQQPASSVKKGIYIINKKKVIF